jgi:hypothetical protein
LGGCASGQILSWDGTSWKCNTISGLGSAQIGADTTPNYLTKWTGAGVISSSAVYESAGKVGIGTTAPGYNLDVHGTANFTNLYLGDTQVTALAVNLNLLTGVTNPLLHAYTNFGGDVTGFYNNLQLGATTVGATELVDTGVTAASYGAILSGTTGFYSRFTVDADGRLTAASTVPFTFENPLTFSNGLTRSTNNITLGGTLASDVRFTSAGSEVMYIGANGKVGIGTTAPTIYTLDVTGNIRAGTDLYIGSIALGSTGGAGLIGVNTAAFAVSTAPTVQAQLSALNTAIGDRNFSNNYLSDTSTMTAAFTTLDTQLYNLSIGVSGMWRDSNGATAGGTAYLNDLTSAMAIGGTGAGSPFYFSPTSGLTINNGTNTLFNLNTTLGSSTDILSLNVPSGTTVGNIFAIYDNGSPVFKVSQSQIESAVPHTFTAAGDVSIAYDLVFTNAATANIDFRNNGTIRTVSPSDNLDLTLSAANAGVVYVDDSLLVAGSNIIGGTYVGLGITAPVNGLLVEGRVGIGTTAPAFDLDVTGNIRAGTELYKGSIALGATGGSNVTSGAATLGVFDEFTYSSSKTIQGVLKDFDAAMGSLGGGTGASFWYSGPGYIHAGTAPLGNIVSGGTNKITGLYLADTAPIYFGTNNNFGMAYGFGALNIGTSSNAYLSIGNSVATGNFNFNAGQMYLRGDGRLGIGTTAPGYNLDVHGTANFTNLYLGDTQVTANAVNLNLLASKR